MDMQLWLWLTRAYFIIHSIGNFKLQCGGEGGDSNSPLLLCKCKQFTLSLDEHFEQPPLPLSLCHQWSLPLLSFVNCLSCCSFELAKCREYFVPFFIWTFNCCICGTAKLNRQTCGTTGRHPANS